MLITHFSLAIKIESFQEEIYKLAKLLNKTKELKLRGEEKNNMLVINKEMDNIL